jgi:MoaA/NifB/PqqE/SkfB family radical SAM enzyme
MPPVRWPPWRQAAGGGPGPLRLLVLSVSARCDQKCTHCQIWLGESRGHGRELTLAERLGVVDDALASGAGEVLLTGGEPLLSADLWPLAEHVRSRGARLLLSSNGRLLRPFAARVAALFDELYVSLDGPAELHDRLRGAPSFALLADGVRALRAEARAVRVVARCTLHAGNAHALEAVVDAARRIGCDGVSFLALDAQSGAFGGDPEARRPLLPDAGALLALEAAIERLILRNAFDDGFILERPDKLRRIVAQLRAAAGAAMFERPACDAPWWSSVVDADGAVRPCFFHEPVGDAREGVAALRRSARYASALATIDSPNQTCARCVCPKLRGGRRSLRWWA